MISNAGDTIACKPAATPIAGASQTPVLRPVEGENGHKPRHGVKRDAALPVPAAAERLIMQIDGAGSSLVMLGEKVTVGPISSPARPDVGLMADAGLSVVTIERTEDGDYLLAGERAVDVNGRPVTSKLLADGDKIALSPRCRMRFRLPTPASTTAVLELSTARLPQADIRRVILLDRELIVGPGAAAHVRADDLPDRAVIQPANGKMICRTDCELTRDGRAMGPGEEIPMDSPLRIGPVGMVMKRA